MRDLCVLFTVPGSKGARFRALKWIRDEWDKYATKKIDAMPLHDNKWMLESGIGPDSEWRRQITQYWDRAHVLGVDTPAGRQAMMKSVTTLIDCCAAMIRVHGDPPLPGYPSGEVRTPGKTTD